MLVKQKGWKKNDSDQIFIAGSDNQLISNNTVLLQSEERNGIFPAKEKKCIFSLLLSYNFVRCVARNYLSWYVTIPDAYIDPAHKFLQIQVQDDVRTQAGYVALQTGLLCAFWVAP
jgi:hypothetical protein